MELFLNPGMLLGLAGLSLPVLAHLLSRRKYDVIEWGAMQFLELGQQTRRRFQLEQLLLLLLRMGLILLVVFALARPWVSSRLAAALAPASSRDLVIVLDGSASMSWEGREGNPHGRAVQFAHDLLDELQPGDSAALLEVRDLVRPVVTGLTRDHEPIRQALDRLPPPGGAGRLTAGISRAITLLQAGEHAVREVVVLTDLQSVPWQADRTDHWTSIDEQLAAAQVKPVIRVVDVGDRQVDQPMNFSVGRIELSRERTVRGFPVRLRTTISATGLTDTVYRTAALEVDGQRLADRTLTVRLDPAGDEPGEAAVEFEHRFELPGSHLVSIVLEDDDIPADDAAHAAISVVASVPVLLVDGAAALDPVQQETWFVQKALSPELNPRPLVRARTVLPAELTEDSLDDYEIVVLADVPRLTDVQQLLLAEFVVRGGGLLIAAGERTEPELLAAWQSVAKAPVVPAELLERHQDASADEGGMHIADGSLELPWLRAFRSRNGGELAQARFSQWWKVRVRKPATRPDGTTPATAATPGEQSLPSPGPVPAEAASAAHTGPVVALQLESGDPLLILQNLGAGRVALMTTPLDADWSTLPAQADFVPLLHELMFQLAPGSIGRNVSAGGALVAQVPDSFPFADSRFYGPGRLEFPAIRAGTPDRPLARLDRTDVAGVYVLQRQKPVTSPNPGHAISPSAAAGSTPNRPVPPEAAAAGDSREWFVVEWDRDEIQPALLTAEQRELLAANERLGFVSSHEELSDSRAETGNRIEIWPLLVLLFLLLLVGELMMTRRLVQGGHAWAEPDDTGAVA